MSADKLFKTFYETPNRHFNSFFGVTEPNERHPLADLEEAREAATAEPADATERPKKTRAAD
jgi:hypothetical protein